MPSPIVRAVTMKGLGDHENPANDVGRNGQALGIDWAEAESADEL